MTGAEIKKYAKILIRGHSRFAIAHAARRASNFLAAGDPLSAQFSRQIEKQIAALQAADQPVPRTMSADCAVRKCIAHTSRWRDR